ncbi:MAG: glutamate racemase [Pseudohongiellaceae bacterium]|jgi:glutamate racemase
MVDLPSILVIDSGVGGLSVCQSILASDDLLQVIYFADDAYAPYGLLGEEALEQRLEKIVASMLAIHQPHLVVLACNTVSTLLLPQLRAQFDVPFVGVVPAIKPAAQHSKTHRIGLLATPATVKRVYTNGLIADYAGNCEVIRVGSNELVLQAEALLAGKDVSLDVLESVLQPFMLDDDLPSIDTIVLGCTHFPLLKQQLQIVLPNVSWVDSGEAVAKRIHCLLKEQSLITHNSAANESRSIAHQIYFSKSLPNSVVFKNSLATLGFVASELHLLTV